MAIRANKLLLELNIELSTLGNIVNALGYEGCGLSLNSMMPDDIVNKVRGLFFDDVDLFKLIETGVENGVDDVKHDLVPSIKVVGYMDMDAYNKPKSEQDTKEARDGLNATPPLIYGGKQSFWMRELAILSPVNEKVDRIDIGSFKEVKCPLLYSVLIGTNGTGKSSLMKEIVDFFIDLHTCIKESELKLSSEKNRRLKGVKYHIDGSECEVVRLEKNFLAKIDGRIRALNDLRLPSIVACHFGAFEKFPIQKVNGTKKNRYDVPFYKYVGAHVNGNMIASSAIAFRLLFVLSEQMNDRQRRNICSILDFIGYDHKISLSYSFVMKPRKEGAVKDVIEQKMKNGEEYNGLNNQKKSAYVNKLYNFYKSKTSKGVTQHNYDLDFDLNTTSAGSYHELQYIYRLKQCELVNFANVIFHKQGQDISSDEMSSGEFAMLSTVLSISAAADLHTLVLLDEPELSLHPNWQMTLIDNLDCALANQVCHLIIATHSHMLVSDLPMKRSHVIQIEKKETGNLNVTTISESTYGWSAEEVLLKVFKTATDRNRYFGERIGKLLEKMGNNTILPKDVENELRELQEISRHLSDIDPMKKILNTIVEVYK